MMCSRTSEARPPLTAARTSSISGVLKGWAGAVCFNMVIGSSSAYPLWPELHHGESQIVILSRGSPVLGNRAEHVIDDLARRQRLNGSKQLLKSTDTELLILFVAGLRQTIGENQECIAGFRSHLELLILGITDHAEDRTATLQRNDV